jgi:VWFA-related protein
MVPGKTLAVPGMAIARCASMPTKRLWVPLSLGLVTAAVLAYSVPGQQPPAFGTQVAAITVDVVVLDDDGQPVRGLTREDFTLLEDGRPQSLVGFEARDLAASPQAAVSSPEILGATNDSSESQPGRVLGLVIDDLGIAPDTMLQLRPALERWIREKADPRDEITITTSSGGIWWSDTVGRGREELLQTLGRIQGRMLAEAAGGESLSTWEAYRIAEFESDMRPPEVVGGTPTGAGGLGDVGELVDPTILSRVTRRWIRSNACIVPPESLDTCRQRVTFAARTRHAQWGLRAQALMASLKRLASSLTAVPGRKSILLASEELIEDSSLATPTREVVDLFRRANIGLYFVGAGGLAGPSFFSAEARSAPRSQDVGLLMAETGALTTAGGTSLAEETGGVAIISNDLAAGLERMALDSSVYYLLGYQPEDAPDGKWHDLKVKVARPKVEVRARRRYLATPGVDPARIAAMSIPKERGAAKVASGKRPLHPSLLTGSTRAGIPLRLATYLGETNHAGSARVELVLEVDNSRVFVDRKGIPWKASLDLTIMATGLFRAPMVPVDEHLELSLGDREVGGGSWLLRRYVWLPPGLTQIRALVRDATAGTSGLVTERIVVPDVDQPYLSTPVLADRTLPPGKSEDMPQLIPTASRQFGKRDPLYCQFEVFGFGGRQLAGVPQLFSEHTLLRSDGTVVSVSPVTPISTDGHRAVRRIVLPMTGLEEGAYVLALTVEDRLARRVLAARAAFSVAREAPAAVAATDGEASESASKSASEAPAQEGITP